MAKMGAMMAESKCDWVWLNGRFVKWEKARMHVTTWSLHYSVAMFEGIRAYGAAKGANIFRLPEHARRLLRSAKTYGMKCGMGLGEIERAIIGTVRKNRLRGCYIRPILYFGQWKSPLPTKRQPSTDFAIFALPLAEDAGAPAKVKPLRCIISSWRKPAPNALPAGAKCSANYAVSYLAALEAEGKGYDYGVFLDHRGMVSEGFTSNVFAVVDGVLVTPPLSASILAGVTRDSVLAIARDAGIGCEERDVSPGELMKADEVFVTGTYSGIVPVSEVGGARIGTGRPGPVTMQLREAYGRAVAGMDGRYAHWLTPVY